MPTLSLTVRTGSRAAALAATLLSPGQTRADTVVPPFAVSSVAPDRQALIVAFGRTPARADAVRYRDLLRLLGFEVTNEAVDTRPELGAAFGAFAKRVKPGGEVAVFVLGPALPKGDALWLIPGDGSPSPAQYQTEGVLLAKGLRSIADAGARETVVLVDGCRASGGEDCSATSAAVPDGVSAIVAERRRPDGSGNPVAGLASLAGEVLPLMQREGLSVLALYGALAPRLAGTDTAVAASPSLSRNFAFFPAGFLAGLPVACNRVDPEATAEALKRSAPVDRLEPACAEAAARWTFSPWFKQRLAAVREQAAFQKAAEGCRPTEIRAYLDGFPNGRYVGAVQGVEEGCDEERRRAQAAMAPPPPPALPPPPSEPPPEPAEPEQSSTCTVGGLDPSGNNWLALRRAPNYQASWSTTRMGPGTTVSPLGRSGEWVRVRLGSGETGWANGKFLSCGGARAETATEDPRQNQREETSSACVVSGLDPAGNNWLALRYSPSFQSAWSQTKMGPGTPLTVLGTSGEWQHVRLGSGETGWANGRFVRCGRF